MDKNTKNIKYKDINTLIFAEYNPRQLKKEQYQNIKDSLQRFGFVDPVIINKNKDRKNIIIGGHQRIKVAKDLKYIDVPCIELDLTLDKEKELNIRLNKNVGEWDYDILANNFDFNLLLDWGFTDDELIGYAPELEEEGLIDDDAIPEDVESVCKLGDIWKLGNHRLLCGDSTKKENIDLLLDGNKADMVFTDPPYGLGGYGGRNKMQLLGDDLDVKPFYEAIPKLKEVYVWGRVYNLFDINFDPRDIIVWKKNNFGLGKGYRGQYEVCFYKGNFKGSDSDVWEHKKDSKYEHPTQKPVELALRAIKNSRPNIIIDIFAGSGSTLIACEKTKKQSFHIELDPHYCDVIINRWEQFTGKKAKLING
tara:strand:+ start:24 stop:1118 length:1095 start_codon:yes stop_codon:yes gene_type:complete